MIIKSSKIIIAYIHDICAVFFAWLLAYILRFNLNIPEYYFSQIWQVLPYIIIPQSIFFIYIPVLFYWKTLEIFILPQNHTG